MRQRIKPPKTHFLRRKADNDQPVIHEGMASRRSNRPGTPNKLLSKNQQHSTAAKQVLSEWFRDHLVHPFPTVEDKHQLSTRSQLTRKQITDWFYHERAKVTKQYRRHPGGHISHTWINPNAQQSQRISYTTPPSHSPKPTTSPSVSPYRPGPPCAGCRAHHTRCDRKQPCGHCVIRGIACVPSKGTPSRKRTRTDEASQPMRMVAVVDPSTKVEGVADITAVMEILSSAVTSPSSSSSSSGPTPRAVGLELVSHWRAMANNHLKHAYVTAGQSDSSGHVEPAVQPAHTHPAQSTCLLLHL